MGGLQPQLRLWDTSVVVTLMYRDQLPSQTMEPLLSLRSASWYHHREAQNHFPEHSRLPFLAGGMIPPPTPHPDHWMPVNLQATTDNSSLSTLLDIKNSLSLYLFLLLLACTYLNNAWDLVLRALPLSVCLFKMNRFMYSPIVSRFE